MTLPITRLSPHTHLRASQPVPRRRWVRFRVEADAPIHTYVVDTFGMSNFYANRDFETHGGFKNKETHTQHLRLPFRGNWHLLVVNPLDEEVAVFYEIR